MGHIDHGKTALLDAIRKTNVAEKESGGITQHIGAYQVAVRPAGEQPSRAEPKASPERSEGAQGISSEIPRPDPVGTHGILRGVYPERGRGAQDDFASAHRGILRSAQDDFASAHRKITFLDTPGHEAFSAIRSRGAKVADLAVLVVAADEGVKPQTLEAAKHIAAAEIPFVVAINKIDKPEANPERVKKELSENGIQVESWGGKVPAVEISAKTGQGVPELLEFILLVAEVEGVGALVEGGVASGVVIEANLDAKRGPTATLLVQAGLLSVGDAVVAGNAFGSVRAMTDAEGVALREAGPSTPVLMTGLNAVAPLGEPFEVVLSKRDAEQRARLWEEAHPAVEVAKVEPFAETEDDRKTLAFIIKADVGGSCEAVAASLGAIAPEGGIAVVVLRSGVGNVIETDVKFAAADRARILGFRVKVEPRAKALAEQARVPIETFDIIYNLIERVRELVVEAMGSAVPVRTELGEIAVLAVFRKEANRMVVGGRVVRGVVQRGSVVEVVRGGEVIATGKLAELQQSKAPADEVAEGKECGLLITGTNVIAAGDTLAFFAAAGN